MRLSVGTAILISAIVPVLAFTAHASRTVATIGVQINEKQPMPASPTQHRTDELADLWRNRCSSQ